MEGSPWRQLLRLTARRSPPWIIISYRQLYIKELRIHAEIYGEGEPLLLHSGLWAEAALWRPLVRHLPGYQLIAFDPPGVGRSGMPLLPMTMMGLASVGAAVLDELGIESAHVLGTSFGGAVAQQMAFSQPSAGAPPGPGLDVLRRPVLAGQPDGVLALHAARQLEPQRLEQVAGVMFGGRMRTEPELMRTMHIKLPGNLMAAMYRMAPLLGWTSLPWLWAIRQPTLIVCGDDDPITPRINHSIMATLMPHARLHTVRGGGHLALVDSPGQVGPVIAEFLGGQAARARPERGAASRGVRPAPPP